MAYRAAAVGLLDGLSDRRMTRHLHRELGMTLADAEDVVARVRAELQLRAGL